MEAQSKHRWITAMLMQAQSDMPALPWERAAKRARRAAKAQQILSLAAQ